MESTKDMEARQEKAITEAGALTEQQLRAADVPWLKTPEELLAYVNALVDRPHDYGTCVYAMSMSAVAAAYFVASKLGMTGFQASCADLDILRRTRHLEGPFILLKAEDLLYPQYNLQEKLDEFIAGARDWTREEAAKKLAEDGSENAHPNVRAHWERLAAK